MAAGQKQRTRKWNAKSIFASALLLVSADLFAGDKIVISPAGNKTPVLPQPGKKLDELNSSQGLAPKDFGSGASPQIPLPLPSASISPAMARKLEEVMDRKKNWILTDPDSNKSSGKEELKYSVESLDRPRSVMEKYFEQRDKKTPDNRDDKKFEDKSNPYDRNGSVDFQRGSLFKPDDGSSLSNPFRTQNGPNNEFNITPFLRRDQGGDSFNYGEGKGASGSFKVGLPDNIATNEKRLERQRAEDERQAEFLKLLQPRGAVPGYSGSLDVLNRQVDSSRMEINPVVPRFESRIPSSGFSDGASKIAPALNVNRPSLGGPSVADSIGIRSGLGNPLAPSSAPTITAPSFSPSPAILDIPKRKF